MTTADIIAEVGNIADLLADTPIYFRNRQSAEGIDAMTQAAEAFAEANDNAQRLDAALWIGEAYLLFSASLPDTGHGEASTSWASANQISKLLGGPAIWEERVRTEFSK